MRNRQQEVFDIIIAHSINGVTEITNDEILSEMNLRYSASSLYNTFNSLEKDGCIKITRRLVHNPLNGCIVGHYRKIEILNSVIPKHIKKPYVTRGVNDIATTHPDVLHWLVNKEDGYKYSHGNETCVPVRCPVCGFEKDVMVIDLCNAGFNCPFCSDKISYPNKYIRAFLRQLPIENMIVEYKDDWTQGRWYDNYFEYNGNKYVVEVDGDQHNRNTQWSTHEYQLNNDKLKDSLAEENGCIMIRINCGRSRNYKIKETLLSSQFNELFDLSGIDWELCARKATKNKVIEICTYYKEHPEVSNAELMEMFEVCVESITTALKKGKLLGIIDYDPKERQKMQCRLSVGKANESRKIKYIYNVYFKDGSHICTFPKLQQVMNYMNENYDARFNRGGIGFAFRRQNKNKVYYKEYILERRRNVS